MKFKAISLSIILLIAMSTMSATAFGHHRYYRSYRTVYVTRAYPVYYHHYYYRPHRRVVVYRSYYYPAYYHRYYYHPYYYRPYYYGGYYRPYRYRRSGVYVHFRF